MAKPISLSFMGILLLAWLLRLAQRGKSAEVAREVDIVALLHSTTLEAALSVANGPKLTQNLKILDPRALCKHSPWRFHGVPPNSCSAVAGAMEAWNCCSTSQVEGLGLGAGESVHFLQRLRDHQREINEAAEESFAAQYTDRLPVLREGDCDGLLYALSLVRNQAHKQAEELLDLALELFPMTANELICATCHGACGATLPQLAREWRRVSRDFMQAYRTVVAFDRALVNHSCAPSYIEDLQVGVEPPHSHDVHIPLHTYRNRTRGYFQWLGGFISLLAELPTWLSTGGELLQLAFYHRRYWHPLGKESALARLDPRENRISSIPYKHFVRPTLNTWDPLASQVTFVLIVPRDYVLDPEIVRRTKNWICMGIQNFSVNLRAGITWVVVNPTHLDQLGHFSCEHPATPEKASEPLDAKSPVSDQYWRIVWRRYYPWKFALAAGCGMRCVSIDLSKVDIHVALELESPLSEASAHAFATHAIPGVHIATTGDLESWPRDVLDSGVALSQCHDPRLASVLGEFRSLQERAVTALREGRDAPRTLVYKCSVVGFCGGHGDRLSGILTSFLLAIATDRAFFIDDGRPVPLHVLLTPRLGCDGRVIFDWRVRGSITLARTLNYNDALSDFLEDLPELLADTSPLLVLSINQRVTTELLFAQTRGPLAQLRDVPFLLHEVFSFLFAPSPFLGREIQRRLEFLNIPVCQISGPFGVGSGRSCEPWIGMHFRSGDRAENWKDPKRHSLSELPQFLACAAQLEATLGPRDAHRLWLLFTDTDSAVEDPQVAELVASGKLRIATGAVHIDRSDLTASTGSLGSSWADWVLLASSEAAVLSASGFGATAAEVGRSRLVRIYRGCTVADFAAP